MPFAAGNRRASSPRHSPVENICRASRSTDERGRYVTASSGVNHTVPPVSRRRRFSSQSWPRLMVSSKRPTRSSAARRNTPRYTVSAGPSAPPTWNADPPRPTFVVYASATACSNGVSPRASMIPPTLSAPVRSSTSRPRCGRSRSAASSASRPARPPGTVRPGCRCSGRRASSPPRSRARAPAHRARRGRRRARPCRRSTGPAR